MKQIQNYSKKELVTLLNVVENDLRKTREKYQSEHDVDKTRLERIEDD